MSHLVGEGDGDAHLLGVGDVNGAGDDELRFADFEPTSVEFKVAVAVKVACRNTL